MNLLKRFFFLKNNLFIFFLVLLTNSTEGWFIEKKNSLSPYINKYLIPLNAMLADNQIRLTVFPSCHTICGKCILFLIFVLYMDI